MGVTGQCYRNVLPHLFSIHFSQVVTGWWISEGLSVYNLIQTQISQQIFNDLT